MSENWYDIARYFSPAARLAAARCSYAAAADDPYGPRRNAIGQCPIGVMVEVDLPGSLPPGYEAPPSAIVQALFDTYLPSNGDGFIHAPANSFIHDWDNYGITDLYAALDVDREAAP